MNTEFKFFLIYEDCVEMFLFYSGSKGWIISMFENSGVVVLNLKFTKIVEIIHADLKVKMEHFSTQNILCSPTKTRCYFTLVFLDSPFISIRICEFAKHYLSWSSCYVSVIRYCLSWRGRRHAKHSDTDTIRQISVLQYLRLISAGNTFHDISLALDYEFECVLLSTRVEFERSSAWEFCVVQNWWNINLFKDGKPHSPYVKIHEFL